jgi:phosphotriesterase-related protein
MATVQTVHGPIDAADLGTVLAHEHLRIRDEAVAEQWPNRYDTDAELTAAVEAVRAASDRGVRTIIDATPMLAGRDIAFMQRVSQKTGVQVVACTGIYTYGYLPHYFENRDANAMADMFVSDIERGIQGSDAKAAFLKCAADEPGVTENVEKVHRAVARASVQTGAPMDRYGLEMFLPIDRRNATVAELLRRGYADRMLISQDFCATIDWFPAEAVEGMLAQGLVRDWSMTLVFDQVLPALREDGALSDEHVGTIFVDNPRRWLTA